MPFGIAPTGFTRMMHTAGERAGAAAAGAAGIPFSLSTVGTANFDNRSFRLNFEITAIIVDREFNTEVEAMFLEDFENSLQMSLAELAQKPFWFKLAVSLARLTSPVL